MFGFGIQELLVILAIVLLIFGPRRLKILALTLAMPLRVFAQRLRMKISQRKPQNLQRLK